MTTGSRSGPRSCSVDPARPSGDGGGLRRARRVPRRVLRRPGGHAGDHGAARGRAVGHRGGARRARVGVHPSGRVVHALAGGGLHGGDGRARPPCGVGARPHPDAGPGPVRCCAHRALRAPDRRGRHGLPRRARTRRSARPRRRGARSRGRPAPDGHRGDPRPRVLQLRRRRPHGRRGVGGHRPRHRGRRPDARGIAVADLPVGDAAPAATLARRCGRHRVPVHLHLLRRREDPGRTPHRHDRGRDPPADHPAARPASRVGPVAAAARRGDRCTEPLPASRPSPGHRSAPGGTVDLAPRRGHGAVPRVGDGRLGARAARRPDHHPGLAVVRQRGRPRPALLPRPRLGRTRQRRLRAPDRGRPQLAALRRGCGRHRPGGRRVSCRRAPPPPRSAPGASRTRRSCCPWASAR